MDHQFLQPWDFLDKNIGVDCHFFLSSRGFSQPREEPASPALQVDTSQLSHQGGPSLYSLEFCLYIELILFSSTYKERTL